MRVIELMGERAEVVIQGEILEPHRITKMPSSRTLQVTLNGFFISFDPDGNKFEMLADPDTLKRLEKCGLFTERIKEMNMELPLKKALYIECDKCGGAVTRPYPDTPDINEPGFIANTLEELIEAGWTNENGVAVCPNHFELDFGVEVMGHPDDSPDDEEGADNV